MAPSAAHASSTNRYTLARRLSHADVDFLGELKVSALLGLLEQAAVEASAAVGFDTARYTRDRRIFLIRRTQLERLVPVGGGDLLEVETHVADFRRVRSLRRYTVRRDRTVAARAESDWVYCDATTGRPVRIPEAMQRTLTEGPPDTPLPRPPSLTAVPPTDAAEFRLVVLPSHLDHVAHVNNAVYAAYLEDAAFALLADRGWPLVRMLAAGGALRIGRLDCEYLSDALPGEQLTVRSWLADRTAWPGSGTQPPPVAQLLQTITRADGSAVLRARTDWLWRRQPAIVGGVPLP